MRFVLQTWAQSCSVTLCVHCCGQSGCWWLKHIRTAHLSLLFLLKWFFMYCNFCYSVLAGSREQRAVQLLMGAASWSLLLESWKKKVLNNIKLWSCCGFQCLFKKDYQTPPQRKTAPSLPPKKGCTGIVGAQGPKGKPLLHSTPVRYQGRVVSWTLHRTCS